MYVLNVLIIIIIIIVFYFHEVIESTLLTQFTCNKAFLCFLSKLMLSFNFNFSIFQPRDEEIVTMQCSL